MPNLDARFDAATRAKLRADLMARGQTLATLLGDVMAGKDKGAELSALGVDKPGIRPEEALRQALDQVDGRRKLLDANDDAFGRCGVGGRELGAAQLAEMPWADRCEQHAGQ
jgi:hypothetical protein